MNRFFVYFCLLFVVCVRVLSFRFCLLFIRFLLLFLLPDSLHDHMAQKFFVFFY